MALCSANTRWYSPTLSKVMARIPLDIELDMSEKGFGVPLLVHDFLRMR